MTKDGNRKCELCTRCGGSGGPTSLDPPTSKCKDCGGLGYIIWERVKAPTQPKEPSKSPIKKPKLEDFR